MANGNIIHLLYEMEKIDIWIRHLV